MGPVMLLDPTRQAPQALPTRLELASTLESASFSLHKLYIISSAIPC